MTIWTIAWVIGAFLVGSAPPAIAVGRLFGVDVLREGTGNPGQSNVNDLVGWYGAALVFVLDVGVGALSALTPLWAHAGVETAAASAVSTIVGRTFSPWLGFRGGRGQLAALASAVALIPSAGVIWLAIFAVGAALRRLALANLVGLATLWVTAWLVYRTWWSVAYAVSIGVMGVVRRLMGSPDGGSFDRMQRLLYDRERDLGGRC